MHRFRTAIEAQDFEALAATLDDDVVLTSPIAFRPYVGKDAALEVIGAVARIFEDFAYETELASEDGRTHALMFRARVEDKEIQGCDFLHHREDWHVDHLTVMVRPLSAALALRDRMAAQLASANAA